MTKNKHDHTATKKIKAWLFAIMLLLPFLFLLPTGLYYGLNQNAQLSERTETQNEYYETNDVNNVNDIILDNIYHWGDNVNVQANPSLQNLQFGKLKPIQQYVDMNPDFNLTEEIEIFSGNVAIVLRQHGSHQITASNTAMEMIFIEKNDTNLALIVDKFSKSYVSIVKNVITETYTNDISTSIINAWNSTWQNPLFSWTSYSPFYAPMQNFTNVFGINNMQISNVLTYLATITAIYIVFDIIIELFTYLTHLIPRSD